MAKFKRNVLGYDVTAGFHSETVTIRTINASFKISKTNAEKPRSLTSPSTSTKVNVMDSMESWCSLLPHETRNKL